MRLSSVWAIWAAALLGAAVIGVEISPTMQLLAPNSVWVTTPSTALGLILVSMALRGSLSKQVSKRRRSVSALALLALLIAVHLLWHSALQGEAAIKGDTAAADFWALWTAAPMALSTLAALMLLGVCVAGDLWFRGTREHEISLIIMVSLCVYLTVGYWNLGLPIIDLDEPVRTGPWTLLGFWLLSWVCVARMWLASDAGGDRDRQAQDRWRRLLALLGGD